MLPIVRSAWAKGKAITKAVRRTAVAKAPMLLAISTGIGMLALAAVAYEAGKKAAPIIAEKEEELGRPLTKGEEIKATAKCWGPVLGTLVASEATNYLSYKIGDNRLSQMTSAANIFLARNNELRQELDELYHEAPELVSDVTSKHVDPEHPGKIPPKPTKIVELGERTLTAQEECDIYKTGYGMDLFYDAFTGVMFYSSVQEVQSGIMRYQRQWINSKFGLKVSDFYKDLHVMRGGMMLEASGYPKAGKTKYDMYEVPAIDLEYRTFTIEDPVTKELKPDNAEGYYVIMYFPTGIDAEYLLSLDKKMSPVQDLDLEDDLLQIFS